MTSAPGDADPVDDDAAGTLVGRPAPSPSGERAGTSSRAAEPTPLDPVEARRVHRQARVDAVFARPALGAILAAVALAAASYGPELVLVSCVILFQAALTRGWLRLLSVASPGGAGFVAMGAAVVADFLIAFVETSEPLRDMALVLAFSFIAALVHQISRTDRSALTQSLAATLALAGILVSTSAFLALPDVRQTGAMVLGGLAVARVTARIVDGLVLRNPDVVARRRWFGVAVGTLAAAGVGWVVLDATEAIWSRAALVAVPAAVMLVVGATLERTASGERRRRAVGAVLATLPLGIAAPAAYLVAQALLP